MSGSVPGGEVFGMVLFRQHRAMIQGLMPPEALARE
jgi:hypothetical protein